MRSLTGILVAAAIVILCACGGNSHKTGPVAFEKTAEGTACFTGPGSTDNAQCSGRFGFSVDQNGVWTAGPSFQQQMTVHGQITMDELSALQQAAQTYLDSTNGTKFCSGNGMQTGVGEVVNITPAGKDTAAVFANLPDPITCLNADASATNAFVAQLDQVRQKYYPVPFPGE
jgi:hypothetical protein